MHNDIKVMPLMLTYISYVKSLRHLYATYKVFQVNKNINEVVQKITFYETIEKESTCMTLAT